MISFLHGLKRRERSHGFSGLVFYFLSVKIPSPPVSIAAWSLRAEQLTVCDWAGPALYHSKEMIKNLIELSDTETYKGVPAKLASRSFAVSTFLLFIHKLCEAAEGLKKNSLQLVTERVSEI